MPFEPNNPYLGDNPILSLNDDPERAARADQLSRATGVGPATVYGDLDHFDGQVKTSIAASIIKDDPYIQKYLQSSPLAAKVSNDDLATLSGISRGAELLKQPSGFAQGFKEGFDYEGLEAEYKKLFNLVDDPKWRALIQTSGVGGALVTVGAALRLPGAVMTGIAGSLGQAYTNLFGSSTWGNRFARDMLVAMQAGLSGQSGLAGPGGAMRFNAAVRPFLRAGREPLPGVDPVVDQMKVQQATADVQALADVTAQAQASTTRERSPELFKEYAQGVVGDAVVGIPVDTAVQLGEQLSFVPKLEEQIARANLTGGDVQIPMADWLTYAPPELMAVVKDHLRVRPEWVTVEEGKALLKPEQEWIAYHGTGAETDFGIDFNIGTASRLEEQPAFFSLSPEGANVWTGTNKALRARTNKVAEESIAFNKAMREKYGYALSQEHWKWDKEDQLRQKEIIEARHKAEELPEGAAGERVIPVRIRSGKTETFNMEKLFGGNEEFLKAAEEVWTKPEYEHMAPALRDKPEEARRRFEERLAEVKEAYEYHHRRRKEALEQPDPDFGPVDIGPWKGPYDFVAAIVKIAKDRGLDTALITNIKEHGQQLLVFNKDVIRPLYTDKVSEALQAVRDAVGLQPEPFTKPQSWMTADQYARYTAKLEAQRVADEEAALKRATAEQRKRQSPEWAAKRHEVQKEVSEDFANRGAFAADDYFRDGLLYSKRVSAPAPKLGREFLSEEAQAALPQSFLSKTGVDPDLVAGLFGYPGGQEMVYDLAQLHQERQASGMNAPAFRRAALEAKINEVMEARHGDFGEQVLEAAKEQALAESQMQVLHEKTLALAEKTGAQFPITREDFVKMVDAAYETATVKQVKSDYFLREGGKAFRSFVDAALRGDFGEMFRQQQRHYIAAEMTRKALGFEKEQKSLNQTAKKFQKRNPSYVEASFGNYIQRMLQQAGYKIGLSPEDVTAAINFEGHGTLQSFVENYQETAGRSIYMPEWIYEGVKPIKDMTLAEFTDFKEAIDSMVEHGRDVKLIEDKGAKRDFVEFENEVIEHVKQFPIKNPERLLSSVAKFDAALRKPERILAELDRHEELGPLTRIIAYPFARAKAFEFDKMKWLREYFETAGKKNTHLGDWQAKLGEVLQQDLFISPYDDQPMHFTRNNLLQVMLHMGNESSMGALARGYARLKLESLGENRLPKRAEVEAYANAIKDFVDKHATKEDWEAVELLWGVFKELQPLSDSTQRIVDKTKPLWIEARPLNTPHGEIGGGYWPVSYTSVGRSSAREAVKTGPGFSMTNRFVRGSTSKMFLKERVVNYNPVDITGTLDNAAAVMQQHIHYISYAEELANAAKILNSRRISEAIKKHFGEEYYNALTSAVNDVAYKYPHEHEVMDSANKILQWSRTSLANNVLPLNLNVIMGLDVGVPNPAVWGRYLANWRENSKLAMAKSREINQMLFNIDRDFREQLDAYFKANKIDHARAKAIEWALTPLVWLNKPYRKATFVEFYKDAKARGLSEAEAIDIADAKIRHRFGATGTFDLPAVMRQGEHWKLSTIFYHWFNTQYNMLRDVPANLRFGEYTEAAANVAATIVVGTATGALIFNPSKKNESLWSTWGKALLLHPVSLIPFAREAATYLMYGQAPNTPMGSVFKGIYALYDDAVRAAGGKRVKKPIQHALSAAGFVTRLPGHQLGKTAQFLADVESGKQHPRGFFEWLRGIRTGEAKLK